MGPGLEPCDDVFELGPSAEEDHGNVREPLIPPQGVEHGVAVHTGHLDVEDDDVGPVDRHTREGPLPVIGLGDLVAVLLELGPDDGSDQGGVVGDENAYGAHAFHRSASFASIMRERGPMPWPSSSAGASDGDAAAKAARAAWKADRAAGASPFASSASAS